MNFTITEQPWGSVNGNDITIYEISRSDGITVCIINYGAIIQSIIVKDKDDNAADVVLGYDDLQGYLNDPFYMGCVVGRFANRIAEGKVVIDDVEYQLSLKDGNTFHHHGGLDGFNKKVWQSHSFTSADKAGVALQYYSKDGEEGYPGNLLVTVIYTINQLDELVIDYQAETDKPTIVNLTGHSYFNLLGDSSRSIENQRLKLRLKQYLPVTKQYIPTGELLTVKNTAFDFTEEKVINPIGQPFGEGYDNTWIVDDWDNDELKPIATLFDPESGRVLNVSTTEPSVHIYTGNYLSADVKGKGRKGFRHHGGICFETQHYPDSPNQPHFPSTTIYPGKPIKSRTVYAFGLRMD